MAEPRLDSYVSLPIFSLYLSRSIVWSIIMLAAAMISILGGARDSRDSGRDITQAQPEPALASQSNGESKRGGERRTGERRHREEGSRGQDVRTLLAFRSSMHGR